MASEIPNNIIPKIESVYTKENGWKILSNLKSIAISKVQNDISKNNYAGSVFIGDNDELGTYKRIIRIEGVEGINNFWVAKKAKTILYTGTLHRRWFTSQWELDTDYKSMLGNLGFSLGKLGDYPNLASSIRYDLSDKSVCDNFINSYVKDKPEFYIRMLDQMRNRGSSITRETKRNMMGIMELAIEMGANGTTPFLVEKSINPNNIPTTTGTTTTTTEGTGTGSGTGTGTSTGANMALIGLGLLAVGLLLASDENKE